MLNHLVSISIFSFIFIVNANTIISDEFAKDGNFTPFALGSRPYWQFSRAYDHDTCWPSPCIVDGVIVEPADDEIFPIAGQGGCPEAGSSFPNYWNAVQCSNSEIRIGHNLFFKKDGFIPAGILGHPYDWEQIVVVFNKYDDSWNRTGAYLSGHGGYTYYSWDELTTSDASDIADTGVGMDHPTIYSGWAKHSMFQDAYESEFSEFDEFDGDAFRNAAYPYFNNEDEMVYVDQDYDVWNLISEKDFGDATSTPVYMIDIYCLIENDPVIF